MRAFFMEKAMKRSFAELFALGAFAEGLPHEPSNVPLSLNSLGSLADVTSGIHGGGENLSTFSKVKDALLVERVKNGAGDEPTG